MKNYFFLLIIFYNSFLIVNAQNLFQRSIGGADEDFARAVIQTTDGGFALAGWTYSFGAGNSDMYIVKLDASGNMQWSKTVGTTAYDLAYSIVQTIDGGYAVAGSTSPGAGYGDMYVAKLNSNGTLIWSRTVGTADNGEHASCIIQTIDNGLVIVGNSGINFISAFYIVKLNSNGMLQWSRTIGANNWNVANSITETSDGGYAVAGYTQVFGAGNPDFYVVKLDSNGFFQWNSTVGGKYYDYAYSVIQAADGGLVVAGYTNSFGPVNDDMYIVKFDSSGNFLWGRVYGGTGSDRAYCITESINGGYVAAGFTTSFGTDYDFYLVRIDVNGTHQWSKTVGKTGQDEAYSIVQTTDRGYAAAGRTHSFAPSQANFYIVKLDSSGNTCGNFFSPLSTQITGGNFRRPAYFVFSPNSIDSSITSLTNTFGTLTAICLVGIQPISNEIPSHFSLFQNYPNPFNPSTTIKFALPPSTEGEGLGVRVVIYDIIGREITTLVNEQLQPGEYSVTWDASNYPSGVYLYKIIAGDFAETKIMILIK